MKFKMTKKLDKIFQTCDEKTLSPKVTALVTFAAQLAGGAEGASLNFSGLRQAKVSDEELGRVACLSACVGGTRVRETFVSAAKSARFAGASKAVEGEQFRQCSAKSLDKKTHHLVSLAACLASGCQCASGHIVEARNAGATPAELARCACIASCVSGLKVKYDFLAHVESTKTCRACAC